MQITGGKVSFTRSVKPADYEKKEATVELSFNVSEGEGDAEAMLDHVAALAQGKALELVGLKKAEPKPEPKPEPLPVVVQSPVEPVKIATVRRRGPGSKVVEREPEPNISLTPEDRQPPAEPDPDGLDILDLPAPQEEAPVEITDKELTDKVARFVSTTHNPGAVKHLRNKYVKPPKGLRDIPAAMRADFLHDLDILLHDPETTVKEAS